MAGVRQKRWLGGISTCTLPDGPSGIIIAKRLPLSDFMIQPIPIYVHKALDNAGNFRENLETPLLDLGMGPFPG